MKTAVEEPLMALKEITQFVKLKNPYTFGVPVRGEGRFFGRKEELQLIFDTLENVPRGQKQDLVILGPRRIGKSSLLYRLLDLLQLHQDFIPVFVDVQNIKPRTMRLLFLKLLLEVRKGFQHKGIEAQLPRFATPTLNQDQKELEFLVFNEDMTHLNKAIAGQNLPRLVLMFDEIELLMEFGGRDTLDWFRSLIQSMPYCIFIVAGSDRLYSLTQDYGSPFYNIFKTVELFPLTPDAARALIDEPAVEIGLKLPAEAVDKILQVAGNTPYFIQGIAHYLVEELNRQQRNWATVDDVDKVIAESVQYLSAQFRYLWGSAPRIQQVILYALARLGRPRTINELVAQLPSTNNLLPARQQQLDTFDDLVRYQIVKTMDKEEYWFTVPLFVDWIIANVDDAEIIKQASVQPSLELRDPRGQAKLLRDILVHNFNESELQELTFDLKIDYESLPGYARSEKVRELVAYSARRLRLDDLVKEITQIRPDINLSDF